MPLLNVHELTKGFGPRVLFEKISFSIEPGEKVGLIGPNGCGKTTLFRILAGEEPYDDGSIAVVRGVSVGYLSQKPEFKEGETAREAVAGALQSLQEAIASFDVVSAQIAEVSGAGGDIDALLKEQASLQAHIEQRGGWAWEHRVEDMLARLDFPENLRDQLASDLSGGQQRRVALARAFLLAPDLLILDEPTNHLDTETVEHLEEILQSYPGAIFFVTHDRYFLDRVVDRILEVDPEGLISHPGNYQTFIVRKLERMALRDRTENRRENAMRRELEWLRRGPKARTTKAKARIKRAKGLQEAGLSGKEDRVQISFTSGKRLGGQILAVENVDKSYGDLKVLKKTSLVVRRGDHLALLGPNGCGKTTLIKILTGEETLDAGEVRWGTNSRVAYLDQARSGLDPNKNVYESLGDLEKLTVGDRQVHKRTYLREFLFERDEQEKAVSALSGGERCRLLLAKMMLEGANVLILDEPTNDLDIVSLQVLEAALSEFGGCLLLVTHDRYFLNRVCNALLVFEDGKFERYDGDYDFYRTRRDAKRKEEAKAAVKVKKEAQQVQQNTTKKKLAKPRKLSWKEARELEEIEGVILEAEEEKEGLTEQLADPELYKGTSAKVQALTQALEALTKKIEALYERWEALEALAAQTPGAT